MELPVLDKFCFILDLKKGCMAMGAANVVLTFVLTVIMISFAVDIKEASDAAAAKRGDDVDMTSVVYTIVILLIILLVIKFVLDVVFVYAVYKERSGLIRKYCIFWTVFLILYVIGFLKSLFQMSAIHVISQITSLAENVYFIIVVRSYLISINEDGVL